VRVHLAIEHPLQLEPADPAFETGSVALDVARSALVVLALREFQQLGRVGDRLGGAVQLRKLGS
jgi:hypothetical protein